MTNYTTLDQFLEEEGIADEVNANTPKRLAELEAGESAAVLADLRRRIMRLEGETGK